MSVNVWYACTILGSFFRKDWACGERVLEMSSSTCGGIVTMETEMEMMFQLKSHKIYWPKKCKRGTEHDVFGRRTIQIEQYNELCAFVIR